MVKPINKVYTLKEADIDYFASGATGANWSLSNTYIGGLGGYLITILNNSATDFTGIEITITGLNQDGISQTQVIDGPAGNATVSTTLPFSTVTSVIPSATIGSDTVDIGFSQTFITQTIPTDYGSIGAELSVDYDGDAEYVVEATSDNIQRKQPPFYWQPAGDPFNDAIDPENSYFVQAPRAVRLNVTSYTAPLTIQFSVLQASNRG